MGNESIYLHRSGPLLENGLDRPKNRYGRYDFPSFPRHFHIYRRGGWSQSLPLKIFFSCSLGGGGRYFSILSKGSYSPRGRSGHLLETAFSEPLQRTLLRTLFHCKTHSKPHSENPSPEPLQNLLRTLPRTFSEPFLERCVAVRPLRRAPTRGEFAEKSTLWSDTSADQNFQRDWGAIGHWGLILKPPTPTYKAKI